MRSEKGYDKAAASSHPPLEGRGIAYGIFESDPWLASAHRGCSRRERSNRIENEAESKCERWIPGSNSPPGEGKQSACSFSICDSPALEGEGRSPSSCEASGVG